MKRKSLMHFFIFYNIVIFHNFVQADIDYRNMMASGEFLNFECHSFGRKLEALKTGNEQLKHDFLVMKYQLDNQKNLWNNLDIKLDKIDLKLETIANKILKESKDHMNKVSDLTNQQYQTLLSSIPAPGGEEKWELLLHMKETLKSNDLLFETFGNKLHNIENTLNRNSEETQIFKDKFTNIENVLNKSSNESKIRQLNNSISMNFQVLKNIDKRLTDIERVVATKDNQIAIKQNVQKFSDKFELTKTCFEKETKLVSTSEAYPTNCADYKETFCSNATCRIYNHAFGADSFLVSCDNKSEGGGWTVIQRRMNGSVNFYRNWTDYKAGFGDINGEFFIGLDKLHALTTTLKPVELLIQAETFDGILQYAKYNEFEVGSERENYKLTKVGNYTGNRSNCLDRYQNRGFTTNDRDNDDSTRNCAEHNHGAWWYGNCYLCNLNGKYYKTADTDNKTDGISWNDGSNDWSTISLKYTQMAIRPKHS